jgi:hypothetical protein
MVRSFASDGAATFRNPSLCESVEHQQIQRALVGFPEKANREFSSALQEKFLEQQGFVSRGSVTLGH